MAALDDFAKIPLSRKIAVVAVLFVVACLVYYFVRFQSLSSESDRLEARHQELQAQEQDFARKRDGYEADVRRLAQIREQFASQSRILPPDAEMSSFLDSLNNHAELAGLEIALVEPRDEEGEGFYAKIPVELELQGRYHELAKFFYNVGQLERIINIENINLERAPAQTQEAAEEGESDVIIKAKVLATTFRALGEEEAAAAQPAAAQPDARAAGGG
jgi:type IV pilus assembly protein PilO